MNPKDLKVGDEVLVKMKVSGLEAEHAKVHPTTYAPWTTIPLGDIYSLAPQFNPGEEIEVHYGFGEDRWHRAIFLGMIPRENSPYAATIAHDINLIPGWPKARKIQKEPIHVSPGDKLTLELQDNKLVGVLINGKTFKLVEVENE